MKKFSRIVTPVLSVLLLAAGQVTAQLPYDDHFQLGSATTARFPSVGIDRGGDFIVVWHQLNDENQFVVMGQRFFAHGQAMGPPYQIGSNTGRVAPRVAMARDGRHVVLWAVNFNWPVLEAQSFNADGSPASAEIVVSDKTTVPWSNRVPHDVAISDIGDFFVVWETRVSPDPAAAERDILGQRFNFDGTPVGTLMYVNSTTVDFQYSPRVAMNNDGNKAFVAWKDGTDWSSNSNIRARAYSGGEPVNPDFQVNQTTSGYQRRVAIDMNIDPDNAVVIAWQSDVNGGYEGIFSRLYQVDGIALENERRLDEWPYGFFVNQYRPAVAITQQRDVLAVWQSNTSQNGDDGYCIEGRAYYWDDTWSDQYQVNTTLPSTPYHPVMDGNARGDYVVAWHDDDGVWARRFLEVGPLFWDGFESGTAIRWSSYVMKGPSGDALDDESNS